MDKVVMNAWQPDPCVSAGPSSSSSSCSRQPMELLCRSWSFSAFDISKALLPPPPTAGEYHHFSTSHDDHHLQVDPHNNNATPPSFSGNPFSFASSETSQMVMARIMSQSREVSPRTSGRLSHSSGPLTDSPPESPSEIIDELKLMQLGSRAGGGANNDNKVGGIGNQRLKFPATGGSLGGGGGGGRTVGRWLKDRKEKRREETRAHNAQLHAAMSVAGLAASVASIAAATAAASSSSSSSSNNNEEDKMMMRAKTDMAVASAAALVAAQCVEAAESMGVDRDLLASVLASAVRVRSPSDIVTLTAAAATALRGAATLKARALKEVWNIAAVIPSSSSSDKFVAPPPPGAASSTSSSTSNSGEFLPEDHNFLGICSRELLARGSELLKRTRKGDLHWKIVSVYINRLNQVMLKMKSRHVAGTFTKKKKNVVMEVVRDMPSWAGRHLLEGGEHRRYFGLKTVGRGLVEFECKNQRQYDIWTQGVSRLLSLAAQRRS